MLVGLQETTPVERDAIESSADLHDGRRKVVGQNEFRMRGLRSFDEQFHCGIGDSFRRTDPSLGDRVGQAIQPVDDLAVGP